MTPIAVESTKTEKNTRDLHYIEPFCTAMFCWLQQLCRYDEIVSFHFVEYTVYFISHAITNIWHIKPETKKEINYIFFVQIRPPSIYVNKNTKQV